MATTTPCRFRVTPSARKAATALRRAAGRQVVLVSWPAGVAYMPEAAFTASAFDTIIGHVAECPVYADERQLDFYPGDVVLDAVHGGSAQRPLLRLRRDTQPV